MSAKNEWKVIADADPSLKANVDDATLVLRLGLAVTAIRSVQHFYLHAKDVPGPAGHRDRLWAFLLANAYLHEAWVTLQPRFRRVRELALKGDATEAQINEAAAFMSGQSTLGSTVARLRNTLVFHFDEDAIRTWVANHQGGPVVWAEGIGPTNGEALYRAATDALSHAIMPDGQSADEVQERLHQMFVNLVPATERILNVFDRAIGAYLLDAGATMSFKDRAPER